MERSTRTIGGFVALVVIVACTGVDPVPVGKIVPEAAPVAPVAVMEVAAPVPAPEPIAPPSTPPTVRIANLVTREDGCEWQLQQLPDGPTETVVKLSLPCHGGFTVETRPEDHRALVVDQGNHLFLVDLRAKTAERLPRLPEPGALGLDGKGVVGCSIVEDRPEELRGGGFGFEVDKQRYPVNRAEADRSSLGRTWRLVNGKWAVKETAVLTSPSAEVGLPECQQMASFGEHRPLTAYSSGFTSTPLDPADVAAIRAAGGPRGTWVSSGGRYPFAVREEQGDGPYWVGPLYIRSSGGWQALDGTKDFTVAPDGLVFALVASEWRLYSTVTGEISWRGPSRPFVWPDGML